MFGSNSRSQRIAATFATATTLSTAGIDVRGWNHVAIEVVTFAAGNGAASTNMYVQGCMANSPASAASATYRRIVDEGNYSAGASISDWEVPSNTGNKTIICRPAARYNYIKIELLDATTATMGCWVNLHD